MQALEFVVRTLLELYTYTFVLRFLLQWARADFHNPLSQFIIQVTDPLVRPLRRIIPGLRGLDLSTMLVAYLLVILTSTVSVLLLYKGLPTNITLLLVKSLVDLVMIVINMMLIAILVMVVLSWVAPYHPIAGVLRALTGPVLRPVQRLVPAIAGLDLSPMLAAIALVAVKILIESNVPMLYNSLVVG
ncbi:MAG: YggT family protein [Gammaproteobacteria bacterium]|nr:YggT family protein [Gammaproteobacteria bacterium]